MTWSLVHQRGHRDKNSYLNGPVSKRICNRDLGAHKLIAGFEAMSTTVHSAVGTRRTSRYRGLYLSHSLFRNRLLGSTCALSEKRRGALG